MQEKQKHWIFICLKLHTSKESISQLRHIASSTVIQILLDSFDLLLFWSHAKKLPLAIVATMSSSLRIMWNLISVNIDVHRDPNRKFYQVRQKREDLARIRCMCIVRN